MASFTYLTTSISSALKLAPSGVWYVYDPTGFSDAPSGIESHVSMLIQIYATPTMLCSVLIDVESVSQNNNGIYVSYANAAWKKVV